MNGKRAKAKRKAAATPKTAKTNGSAGSKGNGALVLHELTPEEVATMEAILAHERDATALVVAGRQMIQNARGLAGEWWKRIGAAHGFAVGDVYDYVGQLGAVKLREKAADPAPPEAPEVPS